MKDGRPVTIRRLRDDDLDGLVAMFASLSKEALQFGLPPYDRPRLERWVTGLGGGVILLALDGTNVIGVAMVFGRVMSRLRGVGEFVIYVHQDYQHQGLGTFLTKTVLEEAKKKGFHRVGLEVVADNTAAVKAYKRAGFAIEGRLRDAFFGDDGVYHEQLVMGIILQSSRGLRLQVNIRKLARFDEMLGRSRVTTANQIGGNYSGQRD